MDLAFNLWHDFCSFYTAPIVTEFDRIESTCSLALIFYGKLYVIENSQMVMVF